MWIRTLVAGYEPYREAYITYPPLYPLTIELIWRLWPTESAQRWFSVGFAIFGALGTGLITRRIAGEVAGLITATLLLYSPLIVEPSRAIMGEFHAVAWAVWAIWAIWHYTSAKTDVMRRLWLVISGACLAATLLTKLLLPFVPLLILGIILSTARRSQRKELVSDLTWWSAGIILPTAYLTLLLYDVRPLLEQVVIQRLRARVAASITDASQDPTVELWQNFLTSDLPLIGLAIVGCWFVWRTTRTDFYILVSWLLLSLTVLAVHAPLRSKHFLILVPLLSIFAGIALAKWGTILIKSKGAERRYMLVGTLLLIGFYGWHITAHQDVWLKQSELPATPPPGEAEAIAFIQANTAPDDCIITDDMPFLYWSNRLPPPELAEISSNRLLSGALTYEELVEITDRYDCQIVASFANRMTKYLPEYQDWIKHNYAGLAQFGEDDLYFAKRDTDTNSQPIASLGERLYLTEVDLPTNLSREATPLKFTWYVPAYIPNNYAFFVQLRNSQQEVVASADYQPYNGALPFSKTIPETVLATVTWLTPPPDLPSGAYRLYVGAYDPQSGDRLPLKYDSSGENALVWEVTIE